MEISLDKTGMPVELKEAWTKFNTYHNGKRLMTLTDLTKACSKWAAERFELFKPENEPEKGVLVEEFEGLDRLDRKKLSSGVYEQMEEAHKKWSDEKFKVNNRNKSNYYWLCEWNKVYPNVHLKNMILLYQENYGMQEYRRINQNFFS